MRLWGLVLYSLPVPISHVHWLLQAFCSGQLCQCQCLMEPQWYLGIFTACLQFFLSSLRWLRRGGTSVVLIVYTLLWKHVPWVSIMDIQQTLFVHKQSLFGLGGQPISQANGLGQTLSDWPQRVRREHSGSFISHENSWGLMPLKRCLFPVIQEECLFKRVNVCVVKYTCH